jgi:sugar lactone lactonase YvrE
MLREKMLPLRVLLALALSACFVPPYDPQGKRCDPSHACPDGFSCIAGACSKGCVAPTPPCTDADALCLTTLAGSGGPGFQDGPPMSARFRRPSQLLALPEGALLVADTANHAIRKIPLDGGDVTTVAGNGKCDEADTRSLCFPEGMAVGPSGELYVVSAGVDSVHRIQNGTVERFVGIGMPGDGTPGTFVRPTTVVVAGGRVIVQDTSRTRIDFIEVDGGLAGPSFGSDGMNIDGMTISYIDAITATPDGHTLYFTSNSNLFTLPLINGLPSGAAHLLTGNDRGFKDGALADGTFFEPNAMTSDGQALYVADFGNHRLRRIATDVSTVAGTGTMGLDDGPVGSALLANPGGIAVLDGVVYFSSPVDGRIRRLQGGTVDTLAGGAAPPLTDGCATQVSLAAPMGLDVDADAGTVYFADTLHHAIRELAPNGAVVTLAGGVPGARDGTFDEARFNAPRGVHLTPDGKLLIADTGNGTVRLMDLNARKVTTLFGAPHPDGYSVGGCGQDVSNPPSNATLCAPKRAVPGMNGDVFFTDSAEPGQGAIGRFDGSSLTTLTSDWFFPRGLFLGADSSFVIAEAGSEEIRQYPATGGKTYVTLLGGDACDDHGHWEYYCDAADALFIGDDLYALYDGASVLRHLAKGATASDVVAGASFQPGFTDGNFDTLLDRPSAFAAGTDGALYIADTGNGRIRRVKPK